MSGAVKPRGKPLAFIWQAVLRSGSSNSDQWVQEGPEVE